ncbi:hypothetical protein BY996DRAFT_6430184 [Phakopsora pachyrhizi]|nr:hypothetical protein BY996DRAFT_6430184 [Phakopsora pachyrhizi]
MRAYLIGYGTEVVPLLIKRLVVGFIRLKNYNQSGTTRNSKNKVSSSLATSSRTILLELFKELRRGFRPNGLAIASGVAMGGARVLEGTVRPIVVSLVRSTRPIRKKFSKIDRTDGTVVSKTSESDNITQELKPLSLLSRRDEKDEDLTDGELRTIDRLSTFTAASCSSMFSIMILQRTTDRMRQTDQSTLHPTTTPYPTMSSDSEMIKASSSSLPGVKNLSQSPTLDFTLFFLVRASDTLIRVIYDNYAPDYLYFLRGCSESILFQLCCWRIMWCWFYRPEKLPISYVRWISALSSMDQRLLQLIRLGRLGEIEYGRMTSVDVKSLGRSIAERMGRDGDLGDIELVERFPCSLIHGKLGDSESCSVNVLRRWKKAWRQAMGIYLPVFTVPTLLFNRSKLRDSPIKVLIRILISSSRSSLFLSSFVGLCWTGICVGRSMRMKLFLEYLLNRERKFRKTVLKLKRFFISLILRRDRVKISSSLKTKVKGITMMYMDTTVGPQLGSFLAGISILIENSSRRGEMMLYVMMRALCSFNWVDEIIKTLFKIDNNKNLKSERNFRSVEEDERVVGLISVWLERIVFSISIGTITSSVVHDPEYVRGIVKGIFKFAIGSDWKTSRKKKKTPDSFKPMKS